MKIYCKIYIDVDNIIINISTFTFLTYV